MEPTGIVRRVDDLGRIVIPIELRKRLGIKLRDSLEIFTDESTIMLRKYRPRCMFCGSDENIRLFRQKCVCLQCINDLSKS